MIKTSMMYESKLWILTENIIRRDKAAEINALRGSGRVSHLDGVRNEVVI